VFNFQESFSSLSIIFVLNRSFASSILWFLLFSRKKFEEEFCCSYLPTHSNFLAWCAAKEERFP